MSFSKAKTKRFNEISSCAPPVGSYNPQFDEKVPGPVLASGDERFKEPKDQKLSHECGSASLSNLCSSVANSFISSTPKKNAVKWSSSETLSSGLAISEQQQSQCVEGHASRLPRRTTNSTSIIPPAEFAKIKDLEKQIRCLVQERNELRKQIEVKTEEQSRVELRLQSVLKERTSMLSEKAAIERDLADVRKSNDTLKARMASVENSTERIRQLQSDISQLQEIVKQKDKDLTDQREKFACELTVMENELKVLTQKNDELLGTSHSESYENIQKSLARTLEVNEMLERKVATLTDDAELLEKKHLQDRETLEKEKENYQNIIAQQQAEVQIARLELAKAEFAKSEVDVAMTYARQDLEQAKKTIAQLESELFMLQTSKDMFNRNLEEITLNYNLLQDKLDSNKNESSSAISKLETSLSDASTKVSFLENELTVAKTSVDKLKLYTHKLEQDVATLRSDIEISSRSIQELRDKERDLCNEVTSLTGELIEMKRCNEAKEHALTAASASVTELKAVNESLQRDVDALTKKNEKLEEERRVTTCKYDELEKALAETKNQAISVERERRELESRLEVRNHDASVLESELRDLQSLVDELRATIASGDATKSEAEMKNIRLEEKYRKCVAELHQAKSKLMSEQQLLEVNQAIDESRRWQSMYEELWERVLPFQEQLAAFEMEKQILLGKSKNAEHEIESLSREYAKLLGHQNQKQKIHHILKLKEENLSLKQEVQSLRDQHTKDKRQLTKLSEKLDALEGKKRFDPLRAFQAQSKENDVSFVAPLKEGNHK